MAARYTGNFDGIGKLLRLPGVQLVCRDAAVEIMHVAQATAPVGNPETDRHSGLYKASFSVEPFVGTVPWRGVPYQRRGARVLNSSPHALVVEHGGGKNSTPRHATLTKAIDAVSSKFR
ncbi:hypothetical protein ACFVW8_03885 [Streptomyces sp. NPDC058221]|uniref:hypothetical protein n=1 Tax=Streptomyces sp. NPDC058221 TaxID=3346388 RepID=UPI0036E5E3E1